MTCLCLVTWRFLRICPPRSTQRLIWKVLIPKSIHEYFPIPLTTPFTPYNNRKQGVLNHILHTGPPVPDCTFSKCTHWWSLMVVTWERCQSSTRPINEWLVGVPRTNYECIGRGRDTRKHLDHSFGRSIDGEFLVTKDSFIPSRIWSVDHGWEVVSFKELRYRYDKILSSYKKPLKHCSKERPLVNKQTSFASQQKINRNTLNGTVIQSY